MRRTDPGLTTAGKSSGTEANGALPERSSVFGINEVGFASTQQQSMNRLVCSHGWCLTAHRSCPIPAVITGPAANVKRTVTMATVDNLAHLRIATSKGMSMSRAIAERSEPNLF
jgi:hypothetical protein